MPPADDGATRASPFALLAAGAASLLVFGAAGWLLRGLGRENPTQSPEPVPAPHAAPDPLVRGRLVFLAHCARCHGPAGRGDGPDAAALRPPPRDLTTAAWRSPVTADSVRKVIRDGLPGTMMVGLAAALSPRELENVVEFVMTLAPKGLDREPALRAAGFTPVGPDRRAPAFDVRDTEGRTITRDALRGKLVILVFWGTSCVPCVKELPEVGRLAARFALQNVAVLPVCADETDSAVIQSVAAERAPGTTVYVDPTGQTKIAYDVQALPSAALIDPDGVLIGTAQGSVRWSSPEMATLLASLQRETDATIHVDAPSSPNIAR